MGLSTQDREFIGALISESKAHINRRIDTLENNINMHFVKKKNVPMRQVNYLNYLAFLSLFRLF